MHKPHFANLPIHEESNEDDAGSVESESDINDQDEKPTPASGASGDSFRFTAKAIEFFAQSFFNKDVLLRIIWYFSLTAIILHVDAIPDHIIDKLEASKTTVGFFNTFLAFSLGIRTNTCYSRWWEGRQLWGGLIFASINLIHQGKEALGDERNLRRLCCAVVSFAYACKCQLQESSIDDDSEYLLDKGIISNEELDAVTQRNGWQPHYFLGAMRRVIYNDLDDRRDVNLVIMDNSMRTLATSIGGCIRVKATGLPISYDQAFRIIFIIFFSITTIAWASTLRWYAPILVTLMSFVVGLIVAVGTALEDPFGTDLVDLPMDKFCQAIETQVEAVFRDNIQLASVGGDWLTSPHDTCGTPQEGNNLHELTFGTTKRGTMLPTQAAALQHSALQGAPNARTTFIARGRNTLFLRMRSTTGGSTSP